MQAPRENTDSDASPGFVSDYLLYLLAAASDAASAQFHQTVRAAGLRVPEWRVLACLLDEDGAMVTQLATVALAEQSRLTRIILQMEKRGLVVRRGDAADKRRVRVHLTPQGRNLATDLVTQAKVHEAALIRRLSGGDGARLKPALRSLLEVLEPGMPETAPREMHQKTGSQVIENMD